MQSTSRLLALMIGRGLAGFVMMGTLLFGCAGSLRYLNAWVLLTTLAVLMLAMGIGLLIRAPQTLERRMETKEKVSAQRGFVAVTGALFVLSFVLAGLDFRFGWSRVPAWGVGIALVVVVAGYAVYAMVIRQNAYASRVVDVRQGQELITSGLYSVVRHPMYAGSLLLFLAMPLVLGSYVALIPMLGYPVMIVLRIRNEENVLRAGLAGYEAYASRTRFRLIPGVW